jgi:response regulator RpfG family c-di-GMP phosphodiesterase
MTHKRILFVDDEPLVLQGLQRMLRGMRNEWDMDFVENAMQALERMAQASFDVVVSDMRMPGMNGAELLAEVMTRHPQTVRIILSGHADKDLILQCVGSTHQYLSKPCEPEALKAVVRRAAALDVLLQNERLKQLIGQIDRLPSVPSLYTAIINALKNPETSVDDVGALVASDVGMTAKILKLVNSAFFGLSRQLSNPAEAVSHLGLDTIKSLVLAIGAFGQFPSPRHGRVALEMDRLWTHSIEVSGYAKVIAACEGASRAGLDDTFVAGLLHDIGKLVLMGNFA